MAQIADSIDQAPESFTTESSAPEAAGDAPRPSSTSPAPPSVVARRPSPACASSPGTGTIIVNGRTLEEYFPNKLHQQLINDPFKVLDLLGAYDVIAKITGGGPSGQAGALRLAIARSLNEIDRENNRADAQEGGLPHP